MLYLRTFGGLRLENGGRPLTGAGAQRSRLAVLAVLAVAGDRGVSRDGLLAIFWPESDADLARGALKQATYALRRDLGEQELISGNGEVVLNPLVIRSDVQEFNQALRSGELERAVVLYRGKFLEGVTVNGGEFDRWLDGQRQHLHELYQDALGRLARNAESRSAYPEAVRWWRAAATADPFSPMTACALMRALGKTGDNAAALRHARIYEQLVKGELDAPADKSVLELAAEISRAGATASGREHAPPSGIAPESPRPNGVDDSPPLQASSPPQAGSPPSDQTGSGIFRRRNWLAAGIALATLGAVIWALGVRDGRKGLDPDGVVLIAGGGAATAPRLDSVLLAELTRGLVERDGALKVSLAQGTSQTVARTAHAAGARYLVQVGSVVEGDSVRFSASVTDVLSETILGPIEPVVALTRSSATGARVLRDRIAVTLAAHRNPLFANWAYAAELPYSWESFEQIALGIQAFKTDLFTAKARTHFQAAAALDSTSGAPLLWEAFVMQEWGYQTESDSILTAAELSPRRFGPWERALAAVLRARNQHDLPAAHAAGHRLLEVVPGSEWALLVAQDALGLGRAREATELSEAVSRNPGWSQDWWLAVITRDQAYHSLGDYPGELAVVQEALRRDPDSRLWLQAEVKALAGFGRVSEVMTICQRAVALRPEPRIVEWLPCSQAVIELAAHGHMEAARSLSQRLLPAREKENGALARAETFADLADWVEVDSALHGVPTSKAGSREYLELLSLVQAFHGDRLGVDQTLRRIDSLTARAGDPYAGGDLFHRAGVTALLGDRDAAIDLLEKAFREGFGRIPLHWAGPFDGLRGYPRFDALARPVEDPVHLAEVLRHWHRSGSSAQVANR